MTMYVVMNHITVRDGRGPDLESAFQARARTVDGQPGFLDFKLLRPAEGHTYISMSTWESRDHFIRWTESESFREAHRTRMGDIAAGPPRLVEYEVAVR